MKTSFILHMVSPVIHGEEFTSATVQWEEDLREEEVSDHIDRWNQINETPEALQRNLNGLQGFKNATLLIDVYPDHVLAGSQDASRSRIKPEFFQ